MNRYSKSIGTVAVFSLLCFATRFCAGAPDAVAIIGAQDAAALTVPDVSGPVLWKDPAQPLDERVQDLISRMSLAEKASQLMADAPALPRLGIPAYSYRNECAHGVADAGVATVFPQVIGMAATWDPALIQTEADTAATEARAKFNDYASQHQGNTIIHHGLSFYAPNINIVRDPRWGRGQETFGEDPFLTSQMAVAFIHGMQGDNPKYMKTVACAKHFAVHSGPEPLRRSFNATPPERDLYETYLVGFQAAVQRGHVGSIMGSYNALNGTPNCCNPFLLTDILRDKWGFGGFVVSDGGAIENIWRFHRYVATPEEAAAAAVKAGCNLFSGSIVDGAYEQRDFEVLGLMLKEGLLTEQQIDGALTRTLAARFKLGLFDPPQDVPWSGVGIDQNDTPDHRALALKVAEESIVLLKNKGVLPIHRAGIRRIAVIGANATAIQMLYGNYNGTSSKPVTILDGIKAVAGPGIEVTYVRGCPLALKNDNSNQPTLEMTADAVASARAADLVIYVGGLDSASGPGGNRAAARRAARMARARNTGEHRKSSQDGDAGPADGQDVALEGEEHKVDYQGFLGGDRTRIELPSPQEDLLKALYATGKPVVFVNCSGSAIAMPWEAAHLAAIVQAWYPGEEGGQAVAEVLFGDVNPAARLPLTFYASTADLPDFQNYSMSNRTYRYFSGKPLFAFGYGLSYTKFKYSHARLAGATVGAQDIIHLSFNVKNTGHIDGDEVAQVYFRNLHSPVPQPRMALCGFQRLHLARGNTATVALDIPAQQFRYWDTTTKQYVVDPGKYELLIGAASDDIRLKVPVKVAL
ncbi:MAG TPA: glycoside hydrolase family 3 C-terminal domain-containing protein [Alphaproteobacteria bacterium]|nr:glycoside hydrolase family 3 C-terminal domain-containing protein [Alphaproteobacteria bacterium]